MLSSFIHIWFVAVSESYIYIIPYQIYYSSDYLMTPKNITTCECWRKEERDTVTNNHSATVNERDAGNTKAREE